ncbi:transmembrane domain-containing protein [Apiospora saccharicola]|uniref:Transmembrane domain-containing protein n=1 Tax=Apiospora saccharicola TaxID=335842 RepID=A0ABR1UMA0_9PEZI
MDAIAAYLPAGDKGYLPYYMFTLSLIAVGNSLQNYMTLHFSRRFYNGRFVPNKALPAKTAIFNPEDSTNKLLPVAADYDTTTSGKGKTASVDQVTPLAARLFGTYTLISAIVRLYASYHLNLEPVYMMAMSTYLVALAHFATEYFFYKTYYMGGPQLMPFLFATSGTVWMVMQKSYYVEAL